MENSQMRMHITAKQTCGYKEPRTRRYELEKIDQCGTALQILSLAKDNLNPGDMQLLLELETRVWSLLGDRARVQDLIRVLKDKYNTARGYYVVAEMMRRESDETEPSRQGRRLLQMALRLIEEGLESFPADDHCARMRVLLLKKLEGDSNPSRYYAASTDLERDLTTAQR